MPAACSPPAYFQMLPTAGVFGSCRSPLFPLHPSQCADTKRRLPTMAQECCTSCDFPLVTPYLSLSPNTNQSMYEFLLFFFLLKSDLLRSLDPKGRCKEPCRAPARNTEVLMFCLKMGACRSRRCKQNQRAPEPLPSSFPNQACYSWALSNQAIFPFPLPLLTIRYLKMFTLRIKSPSGLESVVYSQLLLFRGSSSELPFQGWFAAPATGRGPTDDNQDSPQTPSDSKHRRFGTHGKIPHSSLKTTPFPRQQAQITF